MLPVLWRPCECTCVELIATLVSDAVLSINALQMQMQTGRDREMGEWNGVWIALLSSSLGGTAAAITRYLVTGADPVALAILRWGIGRPRC
jgi:hypothetical protein